MIDMTLEQAIEHCHEIADGHYTACAKEHQQLAQWLTELYDMKKVAGTTQSKPTPHTISEVDIRMADGSWWKLDNSEFNDRDMNSRVVENIISKPFIKTLRISEYDIDDDNSNVTYIITSNIVAIEIIKG